MPAGRAFGPSEAAFGGDDDDLRHELGEGDELLGCVLGEVLAAEHLDGGSY